MSDASSKTRLLQRPAAAYTIAVLLVGVATAVCVLGRHVLALPDFVMVFLLAIMIAATLLRRGPTLLATALAVVSYDFFFIPPYFTLSVEDGRHVLTFGTMLIAGALISTITSRMRDKEREAKQVQLRAHTEQMRSALLSAVSHDLRTPLAAITGAASALRQDPRLRRVADQAELVDTICEEAERLERLLGNLLDMTRLQSGTLRVRSEWVPLDEIVGGALARMEPRMGGREIRVALPDGLPLLHADPVLLEQVLVNLLENAAKYTPPGSPVDLTVSRDDDEHAVHLDLADRGPGIPPGDEERIFEKFQRGSHPGVSGAGLGLTICRGIVEAHEGRITARNRAGGGAVFRITLPLREDAPAAPAATPAMEGAA